MHSSDYLVKILKGRNYNRIITRYYDRLSNEEDYDNLINIENKIASIEDCNHYFQIDKYKIRKIKVFKKTNFCHDKFCTMCKKAKQFNRMKNILPELEKYKDNLYHMILTVDNCDGYDLKKVIKKMFASFQILMRYFSIRKKARNINFDFDYLGAIRSLEITFNNKTKQFHPHLHCAIAWKKNPVEVKSNINKYSYSNKSKEITFFSDFEILVQKVWFLLMNDIKINKTNIDSRTLGYSCMIKKFIDEDYAELFKYMIKEIDEEKQVLTYEIFKTLVYALHKCRQIQGYGCFYNIKISEDDELQDDEDIDDLEKYLSSLDELPIPSAETVRELLHDNDYVHITKKLKFQLFILKQKNIKEKKEEKK